MNSTLSIAKFVEERVEFNRHAWYAAEDQLPGFERAYASETKRANQKLLNEQMGWFSEALDHPYEDEDSRNWFRETAATRLKTLGKSVLGFTQEQMAVFEKEGLADLSQEFLQAARRFAPGISFEDIFQASRNVWTACYLQILLGQQAQLTPAIFAYSMLYPITDNFLDDPKRSRTEKVAFNRHFCAWLEGVATGTENEHEDQVRRLVRMIEMQYPRSQFPQVYDSLLAIFCAQQTSTLLPQAPVPPYSVDVLGITLEKGGTSVLADGVLAACELNQAQMEAIFDYGCFAQFMDDQEDVLDDSRDHNLTVFSEAVRAGKLDDTMNRMFNYSRKVLRELDGFMTERTRPLIELSLKGIDLLLIDACARTRACYSRPYLSYLETFFPVSYGCLNDLQKQMRRRNLSVKRLCEAFFTQPTELSMKLTASTLPVSEPA